MKRRVLLFFRIGNSLSCAQQKIPTLRNHLRLFIRKLKIYIFWLLFHGHELHLRLRSYCHSNSNNTNIVILTFTFQTNEPISGYHLTLSFSNINSTWPTGEKIILLAISFFVISNSFLRYFPSVLASIVEDSRPPLRWGWAIWLAGLLRTRSYWSELEPRDKDSAITEAPLPLLHNPK